MARWFVEVRARHGHDALAALTHYLFHTGQDERIIDAIATEATPAVRASMTTIAEKLRARGHAEGKTEGKTEGKIELILEQLSLRFRKLPKHVVRRVHNGTLPELERWAARLLTAASLDDVFAEPNGR